MMNITVDDRLRIVDWAKNHSEIEKVYLYGSRSRGDNRSDSDIDLAIEMPFEDWFCWYDNYKENRDLQLSAEVHLEWYKPNAGLEKVGKGVEQDGQLVFQARQLPAMGD